MLLVLIIGIAVYMLFFSNNGEKKETNVPLIIGLSIGAIPLICMILMFVVIGIGCIYALISTAMELESPGFLFFVVICPLVGGILYLIGIIKN